MKGDATIHAEGEAAVIAFQNATSANCGQNMYDNRGTAAYKSIIYTTKKIGDLCWMTRNLDLPGGTTLSSSDTNLNTSFTLPASSTSGFNNYNTDYVYNSGSTSCGDNSPCYSYYSFYTATAHWGTNLVTGDYSKADICPKGWRLPQSWEFEEMVSLGVSVAETEAWLAANWNGVHNGYYRNGKFNSGGLRGVFWSSSSKDANTAFYFGFGGGRPATASGAGGKDGGYAIRCVAKL